jgi:hypothetical protein
MEEIGGFDTLAAAIDAAIHANLDLATAMIKKNGSAHTVNDWINLQVAGGTCGES